MRSGIFAWLMIVFLSCGGVQPTPQDVRDWTTTGVTVAGAAIELTQAILALVAQIQGTAKCVEVEGTDDTEPVIAVEPEEVPP